jgi:hypothetical protein
MQVKCSSCGASQIANQNNVCNYCGTQVNIEIKSTDNEISQLELSLFEYKKGNFTNSSNQFDDILKIQPNVFIAWAYKIFSDFQKVFPDPNYKDFNSFNNDIDFVLKKATDSNKKKILEDILIEMLRAFMQRSWVERTVKYSFLSYTGKYNSANRRNFLNIYNTFSIHLSDEFSKSIINVLIEFYNSRGSELRPFDSDVLSIDEIISITPILSRDITLSKKFANTLLDVSISFWEKRINREAHFFADKLPTIDDFKNGELLISRLCESNSELNYSELLIPYKNKCNIILNDLRTLNSNEFKKPCFVATAVMGDYNHPIVIDLREFRDNWLLKRKWGVNFTEWYYINGPKASKLIEKSFFLKKITFILLIKPLQLFTKIIR